MPAISCVVNYSCPNHLEDYVHRVGRTGRAGRKGTAYTFLDPQTEDAYAPILKKALTQAKRQVPPELDQLAKKFVDKTKTGEKKWAPSGFAGRGFKFDEDELDDEKQRAKAQRKLMESEMGLVVAESHLDDDEGPEKEAPAPAPAKEPDVPARGGPTSYFLAASAVLLCRTRSREHLKPLRLLLLVWCLNWRPTFLTCLTCLR